ncbi:MAG: hypothetical protein IPL35_04710 [Sphingobacteriales bacterium]|nr:hypothetical protein [Sphingobacteriales bacterium]
MIIPPRRPKNTPSGGGFFVAATPPKKAVTTPCAFCLNSNFVGDNLNTLSRYEIGNMCENQKRNVVNLYMEKLGFTSASSTYTYEYMINVALSNCGFSCSGNGLLSVASACADPICVFNGIMGQINENNTTDQQKVQRAFLQYGLGLSATEINDFMPYFAPIAADVMSDAVALNDPEFVLCDALSLMTNDHEYVWDRLVEFRELTNDDDMSLLNECSTSNPNYPLSFWYDLTLFTIPQVCIDRLDNLGDGYENQPLSTFSTGTLINFDYYGVKMSELPNKPNTNTPFTMFELQEYIRKNYYFFANTGGTGYNYHNATTDPPIWLSSNPVTAMFDFTITGDDGSVICAQNTECCWIFSTIQTPLDINGNGTGSHPVSGNRQFGIKLNTDGTYEFYTKGIDRSNSFFSYLTESITFSAADEFWQGVQDKIAQFVIDNGGEISFLPVVNDIHPELETIKNLLKGQDPINYVPCP